MKLTYSQIKHIVETAPKVADFVFTPSPNCPYSNQITSPFEFGDALGNISEGRYALIIDDENWSKIGSVEDFKDLYQHLNEDDTLAITSRFNIGLVRKISKHLDYEVFVNDDCLSKVTIEASDHYKYSAHAAHSLDSAKYVSAPLNNKELVEHFDKCSCNKCVEQEPKIELDEFTRSQMCILLDKHARAEKSLKQFGFTDKGGEYWQPPVNHLAIKQKKVIEQQEKDLHELSKFNQNQVEMYSNALSTIDKLRHNVDQLEAKLKTSHEREEYLSSAVDALESQLQAATRKLDNLSTPKSKLAHVCAELDKAFVDKCNEVNALKEDNRKLEEHRDQLSDRLDELADRDIDVTRDSIKKSISCVDSCFVNVPKDEILEKTITEAIENYEPTNKNINESDRERINNDRSDRDLLNNEIVAVLRHGANTKYLANMIIHIIDKRLPKA